MVVTIHFLLMKYVVMKFMTTYMQTAKISKNIKFIINFWY